MLSQIREVEDTTVFDLMNADLIADTETRVTGEVRHLENLLHEVAKAGNGHRVIVNFTTLTKLDGWAISDFLDIAPFIFKVLKHHELFLVCPRSHWQTRLKQRFAGPHHFFNTEEEALLAVNPRPLEI